MGASQSAKVDTYEMKMLDSNGTVVSVSHGKGADKSAANNEACAIKSTRANKEPKSGKEKVLPSGAGGKVPKVKGAKHDKEAPSAAKQRFLKAKSKLAAGRAFASAGQAHGKRKRRRANDTHGWIAKDMMCPSSVQMKSFEVKRIIGTGLMGTVRIARYMKDDTWCVLKSVRKDDVCKHKQSRHIQNERKILGNCDHPFIAVLFGTFQDASKVYFIMEYAAGGELFTRLYNSKEGRLICSAASAKFYLSEIFLALEYLHNNGYCYRDLKPENIMFDEEGHCKLIDFGFVREVDGDDSRMTTQVGTPAYLSPEQLDAKKTNGYTRIVDWWAFGIIAFELMSGKTPFCKNSRDSRYAIFMRVQSGKISFPSKFDALGKQFVQALLVKDIDKRIKSAKAIRTHSWFSGIDFDAVYDRRLIPPYKPEVSAEPGDVQHFDVYDEEKERANQAIDDSLFGGF
jgi:serine/threonine protein kinase